MEIQKITDSDHGVSVAIINFGQPTLLKACLDSLGGDREVVVIENDPDASTERICADRPNTRHVKPRNNLGFAGGCNLASSVTSGAAVLFLNSDVRASSATISCLAETLTKDPAAGVVVPSLVNPDGSWQPSTGPFPRVGSYLLRSLLPQKRRRYHLFKKRRTCSVDWGSGACFLVRRAALSEVQGFAPEFLFNFEDVDLCLRLARLGWETHFFADARVVHLVGGSSGGENHPWVEWQKRRSTLIYFARHGGPRAFSIIRLANRFYCQSKRLTGAAPGPDFWASLCDVVAKGSRADWAEGRVSVLPDS